MRPILLPIALLALAAQAAACGSGGNDEPSREPVAHAIRDYSDDVAANRVAFVNGATTVGEWRRVRVVLVYASRKERESIAAQYGRSNPEPGTPRYWLQTFVESFDDGSGEEAWLSKNGPEALRYVNAFLSADKSPEDKAYITAMKTLGNDGIFDRKKMPRYDGLSEGADEVEIERLEQFVKDERGSEKSVYKNVDWERSAFAILEEKGVDEDTMLDVIRVHRAKNAYSAASSGEKVSNRDVPYMNWDYYEYKKAHPKEFAWLDDTNTYDQLLEIYGGSWPEPTGYAK